MPVRRGGEETFHRGDGGARFAFVEDGEAVREDGDRVHIPRVAGEGEARVAFIGAQTTKSRDQMLTERGRHHDIVQAMERPHGYSQEILGRHATRRSHRHHCGKASYSADGVFVDGDLAAATESRRPAGISA